MADGRAFRTGTLFAIAAGVAFGVTAPLTQRFGRGLGPFATAGLLYLGAALPSTFGRRRGTEAAVRVAHLPRLGVAALAGAFVAPVCLSYGLQRAAGTAASLMLNLEGVFTLLLAVWLLREHAGKRVVAGIIAMLAGGFVLVLGSEPSKAGSWLGLVAVALATLGWAFDNVTLRPLADLDPASVVFLKSSAGVLLSFGASLAFREAAPKPAAAAALVACGATGYGLSLRLYLLAQRRIGAGRTGSLFALAPFAGALVAWALGQGTLGPTTLAAALLFVLGAYLHATEQHSHRHTHVVVEHEHAHRHDDGHHEHVHDPPVAGEHSHPHRHEPVTHEHPHAPDLHHAHRHSGSP
ncbi:MAG TPA: EamA family transporter [Polyangiaceae bacterium]|nr:EamA family transporter [Polyangiaceae bacterium]